MQVNVAASTSAILGSTSGYTEAVTGGGGGGIAVGSLPIAIWDGRIELNGEKVVGATSTGGEVTVSGKAGLMAQANIGGSTLPISFNGVANANPYVAPNSAAIGAYAGFGLAIEIGDGANVTFDANGSIRSDGVASLGASAGIGGSF
jgi:hypothetical protein